MDSKSTQIDADELLTFLLSDEGQVCTPEALPTFDWGTILNSLRTGETKATESTNVQPAADFQANTHFLQCLALAARRR